MPTSKFIQKTSSEIALASATVIGGLVTAILFFANSKLLAEENYVFVAMLLFTISIFKGYPKLIFNVEMIKVIGVLSVFWIYLVLRNIEPVAQGNLSFVDVATAKDNSAHLEFLFAVVAFYSAASLSFRNHQIPLWFWTVIFAYISGYMAINSIDFQAFKDGYHLSAGFALISACPFLFFSSVKFPATKTIAVYVVVVVVVWLALLGARTATASFLIILLGMTFWPLLTTYRWIFKLTFWILCLIFVAAVLIYILQGKVNYESLDYGKSLVADTGIGVFQKHIWTRFEIWLHVSELLHERKWFGWGTSTSTQLVKPLTGVEFRLNRDNIAAHSTFIEILFRSGYVGLTIFVIGLYTIWSSFWRAKNKFETRVIASFMIGFLFLSMTSTFLVFSETPLRATLCWALFGFGTGLGIRAKVDRMSRN